MVWQIQLLLSLQTLKLKCLHSDVKPVKKKKKKKKVLPEAEEKSSYIVPRDGHCVPPCEVNPSGKTMRGRSVHHCLFLKESDVETVSISFHCNKDLQMTEKITEAELSCVSNF